MAAPPPAGPLCTLVLLILPIEHGFNLSLPFYSFKNNLGNSCHTWNISEPSQLILLSLLHLQCSFPIAQSKVSELQICLTIFFLCLNSFSEQPLPLE